MPLPPTLGPIAGPSFLTVEEPTQKPGTYIQTVGTTTASVANAAVTITKPSGVLPGDLILLIFGLNTNAQLATVTGFQTYHNDNPNQQLALLYRFADGSEGGSFTSNNLSGENGGVGCIVLRGADPLVPIIASSADAAASNVSIMTFQSPSWALPANVISLLAYTGNVNQATVAWVTGWDQSPDGFAASQGTQQMAVSVNLTTNANVRNLPAAKAHLSRTQTYISNQYAIQVARVPGGVIPNASLFTLPPSSGPRAGPSFFAGLAPGSRPAPAGGSGSTQTAHGLRRNPMYPLHPLQPLV